MTPVTAALQPCVLDLERIEVLRGPQGSLYGARSMGGTIRLITQQPDLEDSSGAVHVAMSSVSDGGENYNFDGHINVPLVEGRAGLASRCLLRFYFRYLRSRLRPDLVQLSDR